MLTIRIAEFLQIYWWSISQLMVVIFVAAGHNELQWRFSLECPACQSVRAGGASVSRCIPANVVRAEFVSVSKLLLFAREKRKAVCKEQKCRWPSSFKIQPEEDWNGTSIVFPFWPWVVCLRCVLAVFSYRWNGRTNNRSCEIRLWEVTFRRTDWSKRFCGSVVSNSVGKSRFFMAAVGERWDVGKKSLKIIGTWWKKFTTFRMKKTVI